MFYDPRITADDFNENFQKVVNSVEIGGLSVTIRARANFLTIEFGNSLEDILWVPYMGLLASIGEVGKKCGC